MDRHAFERGLNPACGSPRSADADHAVLDEFRAPRRTPEFWAGYDAALRDVATHSFRATFDRYLQAGRPRATLTDRGYGQALSNIIWHGEDAARRTAAARAPKALH